MTKLNFTVALSTTCNLTVTETTGFYDVSTNPFGFLPEANSDDPVFGVYKLSQGYFINILLYNKYNTPPIISNSTESFYKVVNVNSTYANNFTPTIYNLANDGSYTLKRFFIISDAYYTAQSDSGIFTDKIVYYTNGTTIYKVVDDVPVATTITDFMSATLTNATAIELDSIFISTCKINNCYYKLMTLLLDSKLNDCPATQYDSLVATKDLIYMTLESIKYLEEQNNLTQIQKLIETTAGCCGVCSTIPTTNFTSTKGGGCGCS